MNASPPNTQFPPRFHVGEAPDGIKTEGRHNCAQRRDMDAADDAYKTVNLMGLDSPLLEGGLPAAALSP